MLKVLVAFRKGDFSVRMPVDRTGIPGKVADTLNDILELNERMAREFERVNRSAGKDGKIAQRASIGPCSGSWTVCIDSVNGLIGDLTQPSSELARVIAGIAKGDLNQTMALEVDGRPLKGEFLRTAKAVNALVDQLNSFATEITRVAREVGAEGKLGGQAHVKGAGGVWKDLTDSVNSMAINLTSHMRNIAAVTRAVAKGDLSTKITVDARGEILELKNAINAMVDQLSSCASEVTRVAREVGTEGRLGGQAKAEGAAGAWKDLTDSVNSMASNLTNQVRAIAAVTTAVAKGHLSTQIDVEARGEILELKNTINTTVNQLRSFASEVTRVAREVGKEGKLGGRAEVRDLAGTWKDLTDSVNAMTSNLTNQVRNIAAVTTAVAKGDLSTKIAVTARGEILELKNTINTMVDQLSSFASEVTRVAREVGSEGRLGGQAEVLGLAGTWRDLTESVNSMASNLTNQVRNIAVVTTAVAKGDLSRKITVDARGEILELKNTINTMVDQLNSFALEVTRVAREVGTEGKLGGQAQVEAIGGVWKDLTDSVNSMGSNLTNQVRNIAAVTTAVANGDLSRKITVDARGEILELKNTINTMVDQLNSFASEVTRVARDVGTEGKLGGQAVVRGVAGTWKDLTDNVNSMAANLTTQVRGIAKVVTAVANGDLKRKLVLETKGEIAELADTINEMIDTLAVFADQVTAVAREVGVEGKLGGQARVPGAAGIWRDLTSNLNQLAATLTVQVRAIAEVATAVAKGDLTRSISVEAQGELAALKDNINEMILNLRETTQKNTGQDWLKTNLARFSRILQGQRDLQAVSKLVLSELAPLVGAQHGSFYISETQGDETVLEMRASYASNGRKHAASRFKIGEGLVGQCAADKQRILITNAPPDYIRITSGLGESAPFNIVVLPVLFQGTVKAVVELASFNRFSEVRLAFLDQLVELMGVVLNTIAATMRTEELLKQSQALAAELQNRQEELTATNQILEQQARSLQSSEQRLKEQQEQLRQTNEELQEKARLLAEQKEKVEQKNLEVEQAKKALEEKAEQLALASKYKSEFLANMSHELRTPLNNLLLLAKVLAENAEGHLTPKEIKFAETIHSSGTDLLALISDTLDLSKIESGMMSVELEDVQFADLRDYVVRIFRHVAEEKGLTFTVEVDPNLARSIWTDAKRLKQILKNLLSNAIKFTEKGKVILRMGKASEGWAADNGVLSGAESVTAFSVIDTGIGIPEDKQKIIFDAFCQADGTTSRKFGGTGLGLWISREIAGMLGGEIRVQSAPGRGSTFSLFLPQNFVGPASIPVNRESLAPAVVDETAGFATARAADRSRTAAGAEPVSQVELQVEDDRVSIRPGDRVLVCIDNDAAFAQTLLNLAHDGGFKGRIALRGDLGMALVRQLQPAAITLNTQLPDIAGWTILDQIKREPSLRHIPVHVISNDWDWRHSLLLGAASHFVKSAMKEDFAEALATITRSVERRSKDLLLVEPEEKRGDRRLGLIGGHGVRTVSCATVQEALASLQTARFDCVVLDSSLRDRPVHETIEKIQSLPEYRQLPIIVYVGSDFTGEDDLALRRLAQNCVVKRVHSLERLLEETTLVLHMADTDLPAETRQILAELRQKEPVTAGAVILIIDDDVRNIFALTTVLERHKLEVVHAESGSAGIQRLENTPDIDCVLMDVMMPEMDGYETMRAIRQNPRFSNLPIIAVTAKAMKGDRDKCLEAGASDYITKPVDPDELLSLLRVWLPSRVHERTATIAGVFMD